MPLQKRTFTSIRAPLNYFIFVLHSTLRPPAQLTEPNIRQTDRTGFLANVHHFIRVFNRLTSPVVFVVVAFCMDLTPAPSLHAATKLVSHLPHSRPGPQSDRSECPLPRGLKATLEGALSPAYALLTQDVAARCGRPWTQIFTTSHGCLSCASSGDRD